MKKFNMLALIALSLAAIGNVGTVHAVDIASDIASIKSGLPTLVTAVETAQTDYDAAVRASITAAQLADQAEVTYAAITAPTQPQKDTYLAAIDAVTTAKGTVTTKNTALTTAKKALADANTSINDFAASQDVVKKAAAEAAAAKAAADAANAKADAAKAAAEAATLAAAADKAAAQKALNDASVATTKADAAILTAAEATTALKIAKATKVTPAVAKKSAPSGTTSQGTAMIQQTKALAAGFTGSTNTVSKNQLKAITTLAKPTVNAVAQTIANSKMPITATGSISAKTSANAKSKIDGSAFTQGAQIQNETNSNVSGSTNNQGAARAASSTNTIANYSGANLSNINKALGGTPAKGAAQKGIISQGISGAMNMLDSDTKNKGGLNITGGRGEAAKSIQHGVGGLGNVTNKTNMITTGATNYTGDVSGSQNSMTFSGSELNSNT